MFKDINRLNRAIMLNIIKFIALCLLFTKKNKLISNFLVSIRREYFLKTCNNSTHIIGKNFILGHQVTLKTDECKIIVGDNVTIGDNCYINVKKGASLFIGDNVIIGNYVRISSFKNITIGDKSMIAAFTTIYDHDHQFDLATPPKSAAYIIKPVKISNGVWIGTKVSILKGIRIGECSVIGANSVVTKSIPPNSLAAGVPAKLIK